MKKKGRRRNLSFSSSSFRASWAATLGISNSDIREEINTHPYVLATKSDTTFPISTNLSLSLPFSPSLSRSKFYCSREKQRKRKKEREQGRMKKKGEERERDGKERD
jgi:hypothetical protein